jgi:hypothetical protein
MNKLTLIIGLTLMSFISQSQIFIVNTNSGPNSAQTEAHYAYSREMTEKAKAALEAKDLEKAKYYLDQWSQTSKGVNVNFYTLMAQYCAEMKNYKAAKRYYMKAYKKWACYECKEKAEALPKK